MLPEQHRDRRAASAACAVLTVSDTRNEITDASGRLIRELLEAAGHRVAHHAIIPDQADRVTREVLAACDRAEVRAVLLTGGTGLAPRDVTYEAVAGVLDRRLDGFGELFRMLSYEDIGPAAMLSRALGGVRGSTAVFAMPGSTGAVRLAMEKLILPTLGHVIALLDE